MTGHTKVSGIKRTSTPGLTMKITNSESCSRVFNPKTYVISKSSVCHLHTQLRTDAEKPRDQIIRSKNSLLVKLKLKHKNQVRTSHQMVEGFHTRTHTEGFSPEQRRLRRPFRSLFRLQAGGTAEPILSTSTQPTK